MEDTNGGVFGERNPTHIRQLPSILHQVRDYSPRFRDKPLGVSVGCFWIAPMSSCTDHVRLATCRVGGVLHDFLASKRVSPKVIIKTVFFVGGPCEREDHLLASLVGTTSLAN